MTGGDLSVENRACGPNPSPCPLRKGRGRVKRQARLAYFSMLRNFDIGWPIGLAPQPLT